MRKHVTVAVTGAAGQIGYALLFRLASGQVFGLDTDITLQLLELEQTLPALSGVVMELEDCAFPLLRSINITSDVNLAMKNVNWAILVGSVPRKEGMERKDLLAINGKIFTAQGRAINKQAASDVRVFVVGNPCNTNCLIAMHNAPDVPKTRFFAMTMLDQLRAKAQLAQKAKVESRLVNNMIIWGNHSSTQYPDFYHAKINGLPATDVIHDLPWLQNEFIPIIQKRGAAVIKARGASSAASAANAAINSIYHLNHDTEPHDCFSVACASQGEYDVDKDLIFSFPSKVENGKFAVLTGLTHNDFGKDKINITLKELREEQEAVKALGLIQ